MDDDQSPRPSRIASLVHAHFDALPARCKPQTREDGSKEWIPLSGIVVVKGTCNLCYLGGGHTMLWSGSPNPHV
jgi:tRNA-specific adenosine deaminase 1